MSAAADTTGAPVRTHAGAPPRGTSSPRAPVATPADGGSASLATRMIVASAILALVVAAVFAAFLVSTIELRHSTGRASHSKDISIAALQLEALVVDLETGLRGFVLTGNPRFLQPLTSARKQLPMRAAGLIRLSAGEPRQEQRARGVVGDIRAYVDDYVLPMVRIARIDSATARGAVATTEGKRRTDEIRSRFDRFLEIDSRRVSDSVASANGTANVAIAVGAAGLAATSLLVLAFGLFLARSIARPVREAAEGAKRLAEGDLSLRLPGAGPGEVGELTRAFNSMAESIQRGRAELESQNEQLRESERVKSELVSIVSHEVRTPLASVLGFTSLMLQHDFDEEARRRYLGIIDSQARRLAQLVEDFLDARRLEEGKLELRREPVDLGALLQEEVELFRGQSSGHELRLEARDGSGSLVVVGDSGRLAQVVANLLSNAIKYSPEGGAVKVSISGADGWVSVFVRDQGFGIPEEQHAQVFTKFFRGDAATHGISGTGLGLVLSREIVEAHGGEMGFDSSAGAGAVFWFRLRSSD
jgi:signal transduction histidine kinase